MKLRDWKSDKYCINASVYFERKNKLVDDILDVGTLSSYYECNHCPV